jgi:hypothetical protein
MLGAWNRAEHYRDLAEECRRLATFSFSGRMRRRYSQMAIITRYFLRPRNQAH